MKLNVSFKRKKVSLNVKKTGFFRRGLGLMFRTKYTQNLLFEFSKEVTWQGRLTSWFVFFPFLTLWLDEDNRVLDIKIIEPFVFSINQKKKFFKIIEIPINEGNKGLIRTFVRKSEYLKYFRREF